MLLYAAVLFFVVGLVAAILGFTGIAVAVAAMAKMIFVACVFLCSFSLLFILLQRRRAESLEPR